MMPNSNPSTSAFAEAEMMLRSTDTVVQVLPERASFSTVSTRVAARVALCGSRMRTL